MKPSREYEALRIAAALISLVFALTAIVTEPQGLNGPSSVMLIVAMCILLVAVPILQFAQRSRADEREPRANPPMATATDSQRTGQPDTIASDANHPAPPLPVDSRAAQSCHREKRVKHWLNNLPGAEHWLSNAPLCVEAHCDPMREHGMFYSDRGIVVRIGIRVTNNVQHTVRPTEIKDMCLIPLWDTQVVLYLSKPKQLSNVQAIDYQESVDIGDLEFVAGQWNWLAPPAGSVAMFEVSGVLFVDAGNRYEDVITFGCDNLSLRVMGSPETPCELPVDAPVKTTDAPPQAEASSEVSKVP